MKFHIHIADIGRWHMSARSDSPSEIIEFPDWIATNFPECLCIWRYNWGDPYWELRGGDPAIQATILLTWG